MTSRTTKLSAWKLRRLLELFVAEVTARRAAELVGVSKDTAALFYRKIRGVIARRLKQETPCAGEVEIDESYFGERARISAADKVAVLGILKRAGRVYTVIPSDLKAKTCMPIIRRRIVSKAVVYTDGFRSYNVLDVSEFKHKGSAKGAAAVPCLGRIDHGRELSASSISTTALPRVSSEPSKVGSGRRE